VLLIVQVVLAIVGPAFGNAPSGNPYEFWAYLVSAVIIPPVAILWALIERSRWTTVVVGIACLSIAIMLYRMEIIWTVQSA
jgi:RsiW-degrading membrane proteinase PrsW (M82 family)